MNSTNQRSTNNDEAKNAAPAPQTAPAGNAPKFVEDPAAPDADVPTDEVVFQVTPKDAAKPPPTPPVAKAAANPPQQAAKGKHQVTNQEQTK